MPACRRSPHDWATKNGELAPVISLRTVNQFSDLYHAEDMTDTQEYKLRKLSKENGVYLPFLDSSNHTGQRVTKAQAYILINKLIYGAQVTPRYLDSLGRTGRVSAIRP